jgi:hypothetical protein
MIKAEWPIYEWDSKADRFPPADYPIVGSNGIAQCWKDRVEGLACILLAGYDPAGIDSTTLDAAREKVSSGVVLGEPSEFDLLHFGYSPSEAS